MPAALEAIKGLPKFGALSVFDGCGTLSNSFQSRGILCPGFDIAQDEAQNILSPDGFFQLLVQQPHTEFSPGPHARQKLSTQKN